MRLAAHGTIGFRASPRLYRGKVLLFALAIAVVSLAEALGTRARDEVATPAAAESTERTVLDGADTVVARDAAIPAMPEVVFAEVSGHFAGLLPGPCMAGSGHPWAQPLAPRAS